MEQQPAKELMHCKLLQRGIIELKSNDLHNIFSHVNRRVWIFQRHPPAVCIFDGQPDKQTDRNKTQLEADVYKTYAPASGQDIGKG